MQFQGSGFSVELDAGVLDVSGYAFSYPKLGDFPPNITLRFERGADADMAERLQAFHEKLPAYPNAQLRAEPQVARRGDWEYFAFVLEFGGEDGDARLVQKEIQIRVAEPVPTVYIITGTDLVGNFPRFEATYDAFVRSFQPNDVQRLNR